MTELVTRHRGESRDENGKLTPAEPDEPLTSTGIAPRGGSETVERARNGEVIECTVFFALGTDIKNDDELTVRNERYSVIVNEWRSPWTEFGGLEVLCTRGQG
jgi:hypothetical protein